ncbi:uncharacterized protein LOC124143494 isoform X2 [Haliotis rufescens]|uniref:uncharacterized protein LOC124143494 isoform X2 n=1 Tax=Haliotis rufescens TaxID=6454 RepID=UPI00201ECE61|nr:uncharacterized protein LOC124143494 isoform X2 [Haliotis rufescens]
MLRIAVLVVVLGQALAMPELGSSVKRLRRQTGYDGCHQMSACATALVADFAATGNDMSKMCGLYATFFSCVDTAPSCPSMTGAAFNDQRAQIAMLCGGSAADSSSHCQTARQCGTVFETSFYASPFHPVEHCGVFDSYIACLQAVVGLCPAVNQSAIDLLSTGRSLICTTDATSSCTSAVPCATSFMDMYSGSYGNAGSDACSNTQTYKKCLTKYIGSCPWLGEVGIMEDAEYRRYQACGVSSTSSSSGSSLTVPSSINKSSLLAFLHDAELEMAETVHDAEESVSAIQDVRQLVEE